MEGFKAKFRVVALIALVIWIGLAALYDLLRPVSNGCIMTYMYPTYIPISASEGVSSAKYGLYLYHEGWRKIDFKEHIKKLSGVPVLFIPGNGGSYKQARYDPWQQNLIGLIKEALLSVHFIKKPP
nr:gpi inositol-deacylase [Quercus suber]